MGLDLQQVLGVFAWLLEAEKGGNVLVWRSDGAPQADSLIPAPLTTTLCVFVCLWLVWQEDNNLASFGFIETRTPNSWLVLKVEWKLQVWKRPAFSNPFIAGTRARWSVWKKAILTTEIDALVHKHVQTLSCAHKHRQTLRLTHSQAFQHLVIITKTAERRATAFVASGPSGVAFVCVCVLVWWSKNKWEHY